MNKPRKKRKEKENYFGEREEQAVLDYINSNCKEAKQYIYNKYLAEPFRIMKESILRRYSHHIGNYSIHEVESNALTHLLEQMVQFNPNAPTKSGRKTKAYSYCQTILRNYYIDHSKRSYKEKTQNLSYEDYSDEINNNPKFAYEEHDDTKDDIKNIVNIVIDKIQTMIDEDDTLKENEVKVGDAIVDIFKNWDLLFMEDFGQHTKKTSNKFDKNKILLYIKERTRLSTKDIRIAMKPFKFLYYAEKDVYFRD